MDRRTFNTLLAATATATASVLGCVTSRGNGGPGRTVLYNSVGDKLTHYDVDVEGATLTPRATMAMPSAVQYAWPHPSRKYLYAITSDRQRVHRLCALRVGPDGAVAMHGEPQILATRPINNSVDASGSYALTCYSDPANLSVHRIGTDGTLGSQITQSTELDFGIFPHQIRTTPNNRSIVMVTRGVNATSSKPEDPGALKLFHFRDGKLSPLANLQVGGRGGLGYGPRHLDFHPNQPWVYVALERQNELHMHRRLGDTFAPEPAFIKKTVPDEYAGDSQQIAGAIHVHPHGHTVYVSNRASGTVDFKGQQVFRSGENDIAVFSINPATGEPTLIQRADPQGFHVRVFAIDPSGKLMIAATMIDMLVHEGDQVRRVPAALNLFRIAADGRLTFVRKYDVKIEGQAQQLWVRMMALPS